MTAALAEPIAAGAYSVNQTMHTIELTGTENRIRGKTAWNSDTLRGDYADFLILDEAQLMNEDAWGAVGAPMLLDNNGDALFIYTPPSLHSRSISKARDKGWITKFAKRHADDATGRWKIFSFTSHDNPHISKIALSEIAQDMTRVAYRQEIEAVDMDEAPGGMWTRSTLDAGRVTRKPDCIMTVTAIDPSTTATGDEAGIITAGAAMCDCRGLKDKDGKPILERHGFVIDDSSLQGSPDTWARAAVVAYNKHGANSLVAEGNQGGEMVSLTIGTIAHAPYVKLTTASRGKTTRAEPIAALYEQGRVHHVGEFPNLEDEMCQWVTGDPSPNRMDALVWAISELSLSDSGKLFYDDEE